MNLMDRTRSIQVANQVNSYTDLSFVFTAKNLQSKTYNPKKMFQ